MSRGGDQLGGGAVARLRTRLGEKSNFSLTCSLLSQYIKQNGGLGELSFGIMAPSAHAARGSKPDHPLTMNLFPGAESPREEEEEAPAQLDPAEAVLPLPPPEAEHGKKPATAGVTSAPQMTIFYGGRVLVLDNFPAEKARELVDMATGGKPAAAVEQKRAGALPAAAVYAANTVAKRTTNLVDATRDQDEKTAHLPNASDLPIARRISLNRFLEKRKGRIISKAPYQVDGSPEFDSSPAPAAGYQAKLGMAWLGLATFSLGGSSS